jgi:hypothetical protein
MAMKSKWTEPHGKRILYIDLSGFGMNDLALDMELSQAVSTIGQEIYSQPLASVLVLVDLRGTVITGRTLKLITERIADTRKYIRKTAVIGLSGIRGMFLDYFGRLAGSDTAGFDDPESAEGWLLK